MKRHGVDEFEAHLTSVLSYVREFKSYMRNLSPSDPRIAEELAYFKQVAENLRAQRLQFETVVRDEVGEDGQQSALTMARLLRVAETELEAELGHMLQ